MKRCSKCKLELPLSDFTRIKSGEEGLRPRCQGCIREDKRIAYAANPIPAREAILRYQDRHPESLERKRQTQPNRSSWYLMYRYGITLADYDRILVNQGGECANPGCRKTPPVDRRFHVDHDHRCCPGRNSCGKCIRGLLCPPCNQALGMAQDDATRLEGLAIYVRQYRNRSDSTYDGDNLHFAGLV